MSDRYAVIGNPIAHSQSPLIHHEFAKALGEDVVYERLHAPIGQFKEVVSEFVAQGGKGMNVTLPFKGDAFAFADELTERALVAQAVNTLTFKDGKAYGDNTDGIGIVRDIIENLEYPIEGASVLMLGAGGAARGVLELILEQNPKSLVLVNRTLIKAEALKAPFAKYGEIQVLSYEELEGKTFDIIINATSTSLNNEIPPIPKGIFTKQTLAYDMMYSTGLTPFLARAQQEHAGMLADGLGMLVEQAAESYSIWRGKLPATQKVTQLLRDLLS